MSSRIVDLYWDKYFMAMALLAAKRSKDPDRQVGACIVNEDKRIVSTGYNGHPDKCDFPWDDKIYVCHAEMNAILNKNTALKGCTIYVTLFPCIECAKMIIQSGITKVIYLSDIKRHKPKYIAARKLFDEVNEKRQRKITVSLFKLKNNKSSKLEIDF